MPACWPLRFACLWRAPWGSVTGADYRIAALVERFPRLRLLETIPDWGTNLAFRGLRSLQVAS